MHSFLFLQQACHVGIGSNLCGEIQAGIRLRNLHMIIPWLSQDGGEVYLLFQFFTGHPFHVWNKGGGFEMFFTCSRHVSEANLR